MFELGELICEFQFLDLSLCTETESFIEDGNAAGNGGGWFEFVCQHSLESAGAAVLFDV